VIPKKVSLKDEKLIESEDKEHCEIVDYTFVGVLKKKDAGG
jgi:acetylglutamate kinase